MLGGAMDSEICYPEAFGCLTGRHRSGIRPPNPA